jgi:2-acylglycerol O-acyltransferase 2
MGMASVSRTSISRILNMGPGHSVAVVIGGADEALYAKPGTMNIILRKRLGSVKMAILNRYV